MSGRKRNHVVQINMADSEYAQFKNRFADSGKQTITAYGLDALLNSRITSQQLIDEVAKTNKCLADIQKVERGIGNNINQIARKINTKDTALKADVENLLLEYHSSNKQREELWRLIRLLLTRLQHMAR